MLELKNLEKYFKLSTLHGYHKNVQSDIVILGMYFVLDYLYAWWV